MKQAGLYHSLIELDNGVKKEITEHQEEDAGRFQARQRWLESTITQEHRQRLESKYSSHIESALSLAKSSPVNHEGILRNLVAANALMEIHEMYKQENNK